MLLQLYMIVGVDATVTLSLVLPGYLPVSTPRHQTVPAYHGGSRAGSAQARQSGTTPAAGDCPSRNRQEESGRLHPVGHAFNVMPKKIVGPAVTSQLVSDSDQRMRFVEQNPAISRSNDPLLTQFAHHADGTLHRRTGHLSNLLPS